MTFHAHTQIAKINCPYCGERIELVIDCSVGLQKYVEDCQVCCRPIHVSAGLDARGALMVDVEHEDS
jgi:hypothetical protein